MTRGHRIGDIIGSVAYSSADPTTSFPALPWYALASLTGAIAGCAPTAFVGYAQWTARMLQARGHAPASLADGLDLIRAALGPYLTRDEQLVTSTLLGMGRTACLQQLPVPPVNVPWHALQPAREVFQAAILNGDRANALRIVRAAQQAGHSMLEVNVGIIMQALHEVGHLWETNRISVAVEHMATATAQYVVARLDQQPSVSGDDRGTILITGVQGERHQIGAEMATRVLETDGWTVRYLGTHLPPASILHAVSTVNPDILAVSATMLHNLPAVRALLLAVHVQYGERRPRIAICGAVVQQVPNIAGVVGADRSIRGLEDAPPVMQALFAEGQAPAAGGV